MDGSGNYFYVGLQDDYDVVVRGVTTGAGILALDSGSASLSMTDVRNDTNGWHKIKAGVATVSKATSSPSGNVAPGSQNVVLATFNVKAGGEGLEIRKIGVQIYTQTAGLELTGTVTVRDADTQATYLSLSADTAGMQVSSTAPTAATLLTYQRNLSNYINLTAGQTKRIEILGTVRQTATSTSSYAVYTGQYYAKRLSSNDYVDLSASSVQGNTLTVKAVSVSVTKDTSMPNSTRIRGASNVLVGQFVLLPGGDDVRLNSISVDIATSSNFQNVKLMDGTTQLGTTVGTPSATGNTFSLTDYTLVKDAPKVISVYADVISNAATTSIVSVSASGLSGSGVNSSVSLSSTPSSAVVGQTITLSTAALTIAVDDNSPTSKIILAGQNGVEIHKIKFTASNDALVLKKITLILTSASTSQWALAASTANFGTVYLYDGSTLLGSGSFNSSNGTVVITGFEVTLPQDTDKILTVKVNVNGQDTIVPLSVNGTRVYTSSTSDMEVYSSQGQLMDTGITLTAHASSSYHLITVAAPVIATVTSGNLSGSVGENVEIGRFTVSNPGTRSMTLTSSTFAVSLTAYGATSTVTGFKLYDADNASTLLDGDNTTITSTSTSITTNITLDSFTTAQSIAAGATKTYILKASTTGLTFTAGTNTVHPVVSVKVAGSSGYSASNTTSELFWSDGVFGYSFTTTGSGAATYAGNLGTDTVDIYGPTYTY